MLFEAVLNCKKKIVCWFTDSIKNYYSKLMELPDSTEKIARGVALGFSFDFLPIPVISIPLSYLVACLTSCNPLAAVATVVLFKLAVPFFFTLNILTGKVLLNDVSGPEIMVAGDSAYGFVSKLAAYGYPFLVGSLVNATIAWFAAYFLVRFLLEIRRRSKGE
ncbi:MAG: DUF2062 domain-containing protein [Desulfotomaculaceae bacterium]|nr:DUF2062 domain-containing protein [Desulfotomaculaceae bacterium]